MTYPPIPTPDTVPHWMTNVEFEAVITDAQDHNVKPPELVGGLKFAWLFDIHLFQYCKPADDSGPEPLCTFFGSLHLARRMNGQA